MAAVAAADNGFPAAAGEFFGGQVAPAVREIAFVSDFVPDHRFAVSFAQLRGGFGCLVVVTALAAAVGDPWFGVVVKSLAVVDGTQVVVRVVFHECVSHLFPVIDGQVRQQIVFIGHRPPHVAVSAVARGYVFEVTQVVFHGHFGKSPAVVGVEQNQVGFDAKLHQTFDRAVMDAEKFRVEAGEVPVVALGFSGVFHKIFPGQPACVHRGAFVWKCAWVVQTEIVVLWHHTEPQFVKIAFFKFGKCPFDNGSVLKVEGVAGGADRMVRGMVCVGQLEGMGYLHRAVVISGWRYGKEAAGRHAGGKGAGDFVWDGICMRQAGKRAWGSGAAVGAA